VEVVETKVCDKCKKRVGKDEWIEFQEFHHINFIGGYDSVFGDTTKVECDLCQSCLKEMIGEFCRIKEDETW
jgi:hypothetical protein